jgi:hypothetical protein
MELNILKEKMNHPVRPRSLLKSEVNMDYDSPYEEYDNRNSSVSPKVYHPKKFRPNTKLPPAPKRREPIKCDYLSERRQHRASFEKQLRSGTFRPKLSGTEIHNMSYENPDEIRRAAAKLEKEAERKELMLGSVDRNNLSRIQAVDEVNSMLIGSIKAKLQALDFSG